MCYPGIGFTSAGGTYTAATDNTQKQWNAFQIEPAYRGTYEYVLSKAKNNYFFLPLNKVPRHNPATQWMNIPMKHLDISYIHVATEDDYKFYGNLNVVFDGVVFYKTTSSNNMYLKVK